MVFTLPSHGEAEMWSYRQRDGSDYGLGGLFARLTPYIRSSVKPDRSVLYLCFSPFTLPRSFNSLLKSAGLHSTEHRTKVRIGWMSQSTLGSFQHDTASERLGRPSRSHQASHHSKDAAQADRASISEPAEEGSLPGNGKCSGTIGTRLNTDPCCSTAGPDARDHTV